MNDQQAREFVEMLAVPERTAPPPCPLCGTGHALEARCGIDRGPLRLAREIPTGTIAIGGYAAHLEPAPADLLPA